MTETATHAPPAQLFEIVAETALLAGVSRAKLLSPRRDAEIVRWRAAGMAAAHVIGGWSLPRIGRAFDRHHTTVLHALALAGVHVTPARAGKVRLDPVIAGMVPQVQAALVARVAERSGLSFARVPAGSATAESGRATNEEHAA